MTKTKTKTKTKTIIIGSSAPHGKRLQAICRNSRVVVHRSRVSHNQVECVKKVAKEVVYEL